MKRAKILIIVSVLVLGMAGCSDQEKTKEESSSISSISSEQSVETKEDSVKESDLLLMKSFGELWMSDNYYIDVNMKVEYDSDAVDSSSEKETSSGIKTVNYSYIIAEDRLNQIAGLTMLSDMGSQYNLVKDNTIYTINPNDKTYTQKPYAGTADDFGQSYTTGVCLGIVNKCKFENTGKTTYKSQDVTFEKYSVILSSSVTSDSSGMASENPTVTYYFNSSGIPVAEIFRTSSGTTTFEFNRISQNIEVKSILEIPDGYKDVTEQSKSE